MQPCAFVPSTTLSNVGHVSNNHVVARLVPTRLSALPIPIIKLPSTFIKHAAVANTSTLNPIQLASSLSTIILTTILLRLIGLNVQSSRILSAASRMSVQLIIVGVFLLTPLFAFAASSPLKIAAWVTFVALVASKEATNRSKYAYKGQMRDCFLAIFGGVGLTLAHLVTCILHSPLSSSNKMHMSAQTVIPIAGMLFGNALSATTLCMSLLLSSFLESGRQMIELRLSRGANVWEASIPSIREAIEAALMPTVNAMAATGLIFMPGMMTGSILGGSPPSTAAAYQIMIYFAIATSSTLTSILLSCVVTARMFDMASQRLVPWRLIPGLGKRYGTDFDIPSTDTLPPKSEIESSTADEKSGPLLQVQHLTVDSTNLHVPLLEINAGHRIGIRGRSGIGKTQLLRALARLDPISNINKNNNATMLLEGQSFDDISPTEWRCQVMWVSQDRPTLSGTPRAFYKEILGYKSHNHNAKDIVNNNNHVQYQRPIEIAQEWLPVKTWDQPWSDVSGGEAHRISLAIALSLQPKILLLDEPFSSIDTITTCKIEKTLIERNVTALIVSHSEDQLDRFCTSTIDMAYLQV